ncbi:VCBS domain-containing protein [Limnohabitans sp. INBF002]|uniref:VCBS domain-containing protein n=1 Tax=Limnohabitans sp. INBF002 TaxID=2986280 RepID=UPI0032B36DE3
MAGSNGYGTFSIDTAGAWMYTMNSAHDVFVGDQSYTDSITVAAIDGTQQVLTITITGTNDAAIISGTSTATLTETNAAQTATGTLTSGDVDGTANLFTAQTSVTGSNGYGAFSIDAAGVWTYTMNGAHDAFVGGTAYTDSLTVAAIDGTQQVVTVTIVGSNDAAVISGASTAALTETNAAQTTTGTLTSADVDGTANVFTAQTSVAGSNGYGAFSITSGGVWTYTMNSAHDAFVGGQSYTDSITVATADGTQQEVTVTITGSNDAPTTALITYTCMEETPAPINGTTTGTALADLPALAGKDAEGTVVGLAIVSPTSNGYATLWFSLNGGTTWTSLSTVAGLSFTNALVLDRTARIYFQPGSDKSGANLASITQYAWDGTDGAVSGSRVDLTGKTGVSGAYSAASNFLKVSVTDINDVPSLTATATGGPYTGAAVTAFSSASVYAGGSMGESSQKFIKLVLTVSGLADGASEQLTVDGSTFSLTDGSTGVTSTNGVSYTVSLTGTTATVTLDKAAGVASAAFNTLVNSIAYSDVASVRTSGNRVIRLTTLQDSGGVTSGGIDTATLNLASTVNVQATVPVVFDLNRDGTFSYSQVVMDVNGDGLLDKTAWAGAQDGVLVWDKYADAQVHDASQYAFAQYGGRTDLQGLAAGFDTNLDGKFNAQDTKFAQFKIWQDLNQNGISDAGEVRSLADWGIAEINLSSDGVVRTPAAGVAEAGRATATTTD